LDAWYTAFGLGIFFFINDSYSVQLSLLVNVTKVVYKITQQFHVGYI